MTEDPTPAHARLLEVVTYDPATGLFRWRTRRGSRLAGTIAGCTVPGRPYTVIKIDGVQQYAHRLAWLYVHGAWPSEMIDHKNGNKRDNRIANLREATSAQNNHNKDVPQRSGSSGYLGVSYNKAAGRYMARIKVDGRSRYLGYFDTPEAASEAYAAAKADLHPFYRR